MPKKVSASRAALPRRRNDLGEAFTSISTEAAAFVARNPALRAKLLRAAERLGEAFPRHPLHLVLAFDHESGDRDLFAEIERAGDWRDDHRRLQEFVKEWIHDREDPKLEVNFDFHFRR
jgi:ABC-type nitrate/sulfonate/bicarbonate transport system substrate-binding protein